MSSRNSYDKLAVYLDYVLNYVVEQFIELLALSKSLVEFSEVCAVNVECLSLEIDRLKNLSKTQH